MHWEPFTGSHLYLKEVVTMCISVRRPELLRECIIVLLVITSVTIAEKSLSFEPSLKKGNVFLAEGMPDSAIFYFIKSFSAGLSKDSLFYYWAEALLEKNVLDSSLAANFMINRNSDEKFKFKVLKQRQNIYNRLGWTNEATRIQDTLYSMPKYRYMRLLPDIECDVYTGYGKNAQVSDSSERWGDGSGGDVQKSENNISGGINLKTTWQRKWNEILFSGGMAGTANRFKRDITSSKIDGDSVDMSALLFGSLTGKSGIVTGKMFINRRFDDSLFAGVAIEGGVAGYGKWLPMLWSGALVNLKKDGTFANAQSWMFLSIQKKIGCRSILNYQSILNLIIYRKTEFDWQKNIDILYAENAHLQYPVFYTDQTYTTVIDTSNIFIIAKNIMASGTDSTISSVLRIPNSYFSFAPKTSFTVFTKKPVKIGLGWRLNCYIGDYQWDVITDDAMYFVKSRADGRIYRISGDNITVKKADNEGLEINNEVSPVERYSLHRIDNALSADFSIQLFDGTIGSGTVRSTVLKNWSTVTGKIPLDIQSWNISLFFEWNLQLQNPVRN
jgi:hypothetical protein